MTDVLVKLCMGITILGFWIYLWPEYFLLIIALVITVYILKGITAILESR